MLPPDVRVARDAQDLLIECCVGEITTGFCRFIYQVSNYVYDTIYIPRL